MEDMTSRNFCKTSYRAVVVAIKNAPSGYKIPEDSLEELRPLIGEENYAKITEDKAEECLIKRSQPYKTEKRFRETLETYVKPTETKTRDEIIDIIVSYSGVKKTFSENIWMKNVNLHDIPEGNDLPDIDISRRVMCERIKEDQDFKDKKEHDLMAATNLLREK